LVVFAQFLLSQIFGKTPKGGPLGACKSLWEIPCKILRDSFSWNFYFSHFLLFLDLNIQKRNLNLKMLLAEATDWKNVKIKNFTKMNLWELYMGFHIRIFIFWYLIFQNSRVVVTLWSIPPRAGVMGIYPLPITHYHYPLLMGNG